MEPLTSLSLKFGIFEIDLEAGHLLKDGRPVKMQPQPFKLLWLLASNPGKLLTREEIRAALWEGDTYVDFDQGVNFAIRQVREALKDDADTPLYVQTVPRRGYRFIAPVEQPAKGKGPPPPQRTTTDARLQKVLWTNIAEMRMAEARRERMLKRLSYAAASVIGLLTAILFMLWRS